MLPRLAWLIQLELLFHSQRDDQGRIGVIGRRSVPKYFLEFMGDKASTNRAKSWVLGSGQREGKGYVVPEVNVPVAGMDSTIKNKL